MTHDPTCEDYFKPYAPGFGNDDPCTICALIARVREDERSSAVVAALTQDSCVLAYAKGRAEALAEARDAVADARKWPAYLPPNAGDGLFVVITEADALAAIDALRGER